MLTMELWRPRLRKEGSPMIKFTLEMDVLAFVTLILILLALSASR